MFVRILFILTTCLVSGLTFYSSVIAENKYTGIVISLVFLLSALALAHPFYPKWINAGVEAIEKKFLPKSDRAKCGLGLAIICWAFAWSQLSSTSAHAPTGRSQFVLGPIYNLVGNEGIAVIYVLLGTLALWLGFGSKK